MGEAEAGPVLSISMVLLTFTEPELPVVQSNKPNIRLHPGPPWTTANVWDGKTHRGPRVISLGEVQTAAGHG